MMSGSLVHKLQSSLRFWLIIMDKVSPPLSPSLGVQGHLQSHTALGLGRYIIHGRSNLGLSLSSLLSLVFCLSDAQRWEGRLVGLVAGVKVMSNSSDKKISCNLDKCCFLVLLYLLWLSHAFFKFSHTSIPYILLPTTQSPDQALPSSKSLPLMTDLFPRLVCLPSP